MSTSRIGSVCTGYGGLDMAIEAVTGGRLAWVAEHEPPTEKNPRPSQAAARLLKHNYPDVPNLGDITTVDWTTVPPIDVLGGGTPCQDVSHAGRTAGMREGTRSGLWSSMVTAIDVLRPSLVVWENVRGVTYVGADSDLERCPICVGDGSGDALRALGRVLGDLADLGYDAEWVGLPASAVGAPHNRFRIFLAAHPGGSRWAPSWPAFSGGRPQENSSWGSAAVANGARLEGPEPAAGRQLPDGRALAHTDRDAVPDAQGERRREGRPEPTGIERGPDAAVRSDAPAYPDSDGLEEFGRIEPEQRNADGRGDPDIAWGRYELAVRRWERVTGRRAPAPSAPGRNGPRLAPAFSEWMMGLPAGWVTDVPGISRNDQLKIIGNGVVPLQAVAALQHLLARRTQALSGDGDSRDVRATVVADQLAQRCLDALGDLGAVSAPSGSSVVLGQLDLNSQLHEATVGQKTAGTNRSPMKGGQT